MQQPKDKQTKQIKGVDADVWMRFRAIAARRGIKGAKALEFLVDYYEQQASGQQTSGQG